MTHRRIFYRKLHTQDNLEIFLVAAISSLLLLRFFLFASGYPQVGGGSLHIAHMLYGGLFMLIAIILLLSFIGYRVHRLASLIGGAGFGIFIDELGKFITKDNNYFFRPTVGIIYALFCVLYLAFNFLGKNHKLTSVEYQLNALHQLEEAVVGDMDPTERIAAVNLLAKADQRSVITKDLQVLLTKLETVEPKKSHLLKSRDFVSTRYFAFWKNSRSRYILTALIAVLVLLVSAGVSRGLYRDATTIQLLFFATRPYASQLIVGQLIASLVVAGFSIAGFIQLKDSRSKALELFRRALLINIMLTEFFIFSRVQFAAIPGFALNLLLLYGVHFALNQEQRVPKQSL